MDWSMENTGAGKVEEEYLLEPGLRWEFQRLLRSPRELESLLAELGIGHDDEMTPHDVLDKARRNLAARRPSTYGNPQPPIPNPQSPIP
jgi:hypothetical protein